MDNPKNDKLRKLLNSSEIEKLQYGDIKLKTKFGFTSNTRSPIKIEGSTNNTNSDTNMMLSMSASPPIDEFRKPRRRSSSFIEKGLDHMMHDQVSMDDLTFSFNIRSRKVNGQPMYIIEQMNLAHTHAPIHRMEFTVDQLIAFHLFIADSMEDPRNAPELPTTLLQEDIQEKDMIDNNIILKQFLDEVFHICGREILEEFQQNKKVILEDVSNFKQTVHTKIAKKEEELDKLNSEIYVKLRRKRSFKLYKVRKIGYQLYYFNSKRIKNTDNTQLAGGFILLDHIIDVMDEVPNKKKKRYPELEKLGQKMSNFFVSTYSVTKKVAKIFKFACPSNKLKFWKSFFYFCSHKYATVDALRQNPELIAGYTQYLLTRTPVFDWVKILPALEKLDLWFVTLANDRKQITNKFDMGLFVLAISILVGTHHHKLILQVMRTIYNTIQIFTEPQREKLLEYFFVETTFYNFFLSWNLDMRTYFQFLLCFKVLKIREPVLTPFLEQRKVNPKAEFSNVPPLVAPFLNVDLKFYLLMKQRIQAVVDNSPSVQSYPLNYRIQALNSWNKLKRMYKEEYEGQTISPLVRKFPVLRPPVLIQFNPMHQY